MHLIAANQFKIYSRTGKGVLKSGRMTASRVNASWEGDYRCEYLKFRSEGWIYTSKALGLGLWSVSARGSRSMITWASKYA